MNQMKTSVIWRRLVVDGRRIATTPEIHALAESIGTDAETSLRYLLDQGYLHRILKGIFYVPTPNEREQGYFESSIYEMVAEALPYKGVNLWYLGLQTALKLNAMTHEHYAMDFVVTDSYKTTKAIGILGGRFRFLKWSGSHFGFGTIERGGLRFSDPEKTVLDITYRRYRRGADADYAFSPLLEYGEILARERILGYLVHYPKRFENIARWRI